MKKPNFKELKSTITNEEILIINSVLTRVNGIKGTKLIYAISRTLSKLKPVVNALSMDECIPKTEEFNKYNEELGEIASKYSKGKVKTINGQQVHAFPWDDETNKDTALQAKYEREVIELREKYKDELDKRSESEREYFKFIKEPFSEDINEYIHRISYDELENCEVPDSMRVVLNYIIKD